MSGRGSIWVVWLAGVLVAPALPAANPAPAPATAVMPAPIPALPLTREQVTDGLRRDLAAHFNLEGELEIELLRGWTPPARVAAAWNVTVTEFPAVASSSMMVRCRISGDDQLVAEPTLVLRAAWWRDAWATRAPLTANTTFDPAQLESRRVDFLRERDALPTAVGDRSFLFMRGVPPGHLLTWRDVSRRPLVKRGELVEVAAVDGALTVTMKAVAMENGGQGDTVTVRNPESRRDFAALVIDENRVQVRF